ncbi:MAG: hypothetical protein ACTSYM_00120 [Candidatus Baldrarchaeia archaeon]|nr:hypothetical protein [Candidatus Freyrarchaeum guaymaensis]
MREVLRKAAIVGFGEAKFERRSKKSIVELCAEACVNAIRKVNIEKDEVDGLLASPSYLAEFGPDFMVKTATKISDYLGMKPRLSTTMTSGGVTIYNQLMFAVFAIASGYVDCVLCVGGGSLGGGRTSGSSRTPSLSFLTAPTSFPSTLCQRSGTCMSLGLPWSSWQVWL